MVKNDEVVRKDEKYARIRKYISKYDRNTSKLLVEKFKNFKYNVRVKTKKRGI